MPDESQIPELRDAVARACRILAMEGVVDGVLGHVSVRVGEDRMLIRGRGPGATTAPKPNARASECEPRSARAEVRDPA